MQLLFIENREKTRFWAAVAAQLADEGHSIFWAVQNPLFAKDLPGTVHIMPFPPRGTGDVPWKPEDWPILVTDRGRQYFDAGHAHYGHYADELATIFDAVRPELVMGEATLFHELLAVAEARSRNIPYLHPSAERYPPDRFCFFHDLTQHGFSGSGEDYPDSEAAEYAEKIAKGQVKLLYMSVSSGFRRKLRKIEWAWTRARVFAARLSGERYNTPGMMRKLQLGRVVKRHLTEWEARAYIPLADETLILYPIQMAPEANIDIWGRPFHDQLAVIRELLDALPTGHKLALKCNPKAKYELSDELMGLVRTDDRIVLLPVAMPMAQAMDISVGAVTVCGTAGFEAVFGRGRCISLRHPVITEACPSHSASTPREAVKRLLTEPEAGVGTPETAVRLLKAIHARSYPGLISDPFSSPECLNPANVARVAFAVSQILPQLVHYPQPQDIPQ